MRIDFLRRHLGPMRCATNDGVRVGGYFHGSIMETFEWARGYRERFVRQGLTVRQVWYRVLYRKVAFHIFAWQRLTFTLKLGRALKVK